MAISDEAESPGQLPLEPTIKDTLGALFNYYFSIQNLTLSQRILLHPRGKDQQSQTLNDHCKVKWDLSMVNTKFKA